MASKGKELYEFGPFQLDPCQARAATDWGPST
jgi:hypothetical protein